MTEPIQTIKVFVNQENCITFTCPACSKPASIKVESLKKKISPLKVRCACKTIFSLDIDFRRFYRKQTNISGTYRSIQPHSIREDDVLIVNLSREGIGFRVFTGQKIKTGDKLELKFNLDDKKTTSLRKEVDVINVDGDFIGCRFAGKEIFEQALGYYLQR
ncbi:MAG: PilZ domain-containing protein [Desulfobulbaceae bacterium]|nr:PilZ domain-containing protein [Desulfobulbaceae bacterium]